MIDYHSIMDRLLLGLVSKKKPPEAESQTPYDVLADAKLELERPRTKVATIDADLEQGKADANAAALDDALGDKGAAGKVAEIESKLATLKSKRNSIFPFSLQIPHDMAEQVSA